MRFTGRLRAQAAARAPTCWRPRRRTPPATSPRSSDCASESSSADPARGLPRRKSRMSALRYRVLDLALARSRCPTPCCASARVRRVAARAPRGPRRRRGPGGPPARAARAHVHRPDRRGPREGQRAALRAAGRVPRARCSGRGASTPAGCGSRGPTTLAAAEEAMLALVRARPGPRRHAHPRPRLRLGLAVAVAGRAATRPRRSSASPTPTASASSSRPRPRRRGLRNLRSSPPTSTTSPPRARSTA